ncbi:Protein of unknown function [Cnuella takakiae]|uniref:YetF C-terminal domain-containing protein n=1 Tax=Cnuella takakiae TaxID=1302690 RepID=A0A1M5DDS2_9BACT|nr:YetF domain-containing protein [Cnuella takakiae]OLY94004.1 hypothetical protein BUE76_20535 [Cnuella takakiae]SHF65076.1 Protein of unknown function [Cnuella takakiae]
MNPVIRAIVIYLFLLIVFRFMGKRSLASTTTFDFVVLLIISEVIQNALVGEDYSLTNGLLLIATLMGMDVILSLVKSKFKKFDQVAEGVPLIIVEQGKPLYERMQKTGVEIDDIMQAARMLQGLERMDQIRYAVLEKDGSISIIPQNG